MDSNFKFPSGIPMNGATHAAEDVGVFASGPYSHVRIGLF